MGSTCHGDNPISDFVHMVEEVPGRAGGDRVSPSHGGGRVTRGDLVIGQ